jgi:hypothetical protein
MPDEPVQPTAEGGPADPTVGEAAGEGGPATIEFEGEGPLADATFTPAAALREPVTAEPPAAEDAECEDAAPATATTPPPPPPPVLGQHGAEPLPVIEPETEYEVVVDTIGHGLFLLSRGARFTAGMMAQVYRHLFTGARVDPGTPDAAPAFDLPWLLQEGAVRPVPRAPAPEPAAPRARRGHRASAPEPADEVPPPSDTAPAADAPEPVEVH